MCLPLAVKTLSNGGRYQPTAPLQLLFDKSTPFAVARKCVIDTPPPPPPLSFSFSFSFFVFLFSFFFFRFPTPPRSGLLGISKFLRSLWNDLNFQIVSDWFNSRVTIAACNCRLTSSPSPSSSSVEFQISLPLIKPFEFSEPFSSLQFQFRRCLLPISSPPWEISFRFLRFRNGSFNLYSNSNIIRRQFRFKLIFIKRKKKREKRTKRLHRHLPQKKRFPSIFIDFKINLNFLSLSLSLTHLSFLQKSNVNMANVPSTYTHSWS